MSEEHGAEKDVTVTARRGGKNLRVVEWFNAVCPVGSHVLYWPGAREGDPRRSVTRSEAWLLGDHTPVVMVEGYAGGIALSHVMGYDPDTTVLPPAERVGCLCPTEHDGDYGSSGHAGPCPPHTCGTPPAADHPEEV